MSASDAFNEQELTPHRSLAAALSPLQASLVRTKHGWALELTPLSVADLVATWAARRGHARSNVVFDLDQVEWRHGHRACTLGQIARRLSIGPIVELNENVLVLDDDALLGLVNLVPTRRLRLAQVDGPVEPRDATAIVEATRRSVSPLAVELRATAAADVRDDRHVVLHVRDRFHALAAVAESFRQYVAGVFRRAAGRVTPPPPWMLERLLGVSGTLTVRPIETEVYSTSIDVGISTRGHGEHEPADRSLVFDVYSRTWHDE